MPVNSGSFATFCSGLILHWLIKKSVSGAHKMDSGNNLLVGKYLGKSYREALKYILTFLGFCNLVRLSK